VRSVVDRLDVPSSGERVKGTRILIAGAVAFLLVFAGWAFYVASHPTSTTLFPVDLQVYRDGGLIVRHISPPYQANLAHPLYDWPTNNEALKFTYTPFAALFFAAVSFVPWSILPHLSQIVNLLALLAATWFTMGALGYQSRRVRAGGALLGAAAGLLTEPVFRTMYLGQINLLLMALIIWDLSQPDTASRSRWKGIATGICAGIKLTPLIFIPYLLLTRKFRAAGNASGAFVVTMLLGFLILPGDSRDYWLNGLFIQDGRTGFVGWGGNQSLRAMVTRLAGSINAGTPIWIVGAVLVTVLGLLIATMLHRAGHPMLGLLTAALVGLLDSPISWDHHWVWVVPGMMVAVHYGVRAWQAGRHRGGALGCVALAVGMLLIFAPWPGSLWSVKTTGPGDFTKGLIWSAPSTRVIKYIEFGDKKWFLEYHWRGLQVLAGNAYVLTGLVALAILGFTALVVSSAPAREDDTPSAAPVVPGPADASANAVLSVTRQPRGPAVGGLLA